MFKKILNFILKIFGIKKEKKKKNDTDDIYPMW